MITDMYEYLVQAADEIATAMHEHRRIPSAVFYDFQATLSSLCLLLMGGVRRDLAIGLTINSVEFQMHAGRLVACYMTPEVEKVVREGGKLHLPLRLGRLLQFWVDVRDFH